MGQSLPGEIGSGRFAITLQSLQLRSFAELYLVHFDQHIITLSPHFLPLAYVMIL